MLKGLLTDCIVHFRECIILNASLFVACIAAGVMLGKSGKKTDERIKALLLMTFVSFLLLIIPVSASVIRIIFGTYYDVPDIWGIIPLIPLGAVCRSGMAGELFADLRRETKSTVALACALTAGAVLLCGSLGTLEEQSQGRYENASVSEREAAGYICEHYNSFAIVANDDITAALHGFSGDVQNSLGKKYNDTDFQFYNPQKGNGCCSDLYGGRKNRSR